MLIHKLFEGEVEVERLLERNIINNVMAYYATSPATMSLH